MALLRGGIRVGKTLVKALKGEEPQASNPKYPKEGLR